MQKKPSSLPKKPVHVKKTTSWGSVANWYDNLLEKNPDNYQERVIAPNILRVLNIKKGMRILDVACGQGFFTRKYFEAGATVAGADISKSLISHAQKHSPTIPFYATPAHKLPFAKNESFDAVTITLAIQNIENILEVFAEINRVLAKQGRLILIMNHPVFRNPKQTSWGWDEKEKVQYRRVDGYLSSSKNSIVMHPGEKNSATTISYHRSLQDFFKALSKAGFSVTHLEEWISHKTSEPGPRQKAEDIARKEIPLFMMLEAKKV